MWSFRLFISGFLFFFGVALLIFSFFAIKVLNRLEKYMKSRGITSVPIEKLPEIFNSKDKF